MWQITLEPGCSSIGTGRILPDVEAPVEGVVQMERAMNADSDIDAIRQQAIVSSLAGFPILLVFAFVWTAAGALSYFVPADVAPWVYLVLGVPAMPIAIALEKRLGTSE